MRRSERRRVAQNNKKKAAYAPKREARGAKTLSERRISKETGAISPAYCPPEAIAGQLGALPPPGQKPSPSKIALEK